MTFRNKYNLLQWVVNKGLKIVPTCCDCNSSIGPHIVIPKGKVFLNKKTTFKSKTKSKINRCILECSPMYMVESENNDVLFVAWEKHAEKNEIVRGVSDRIGRAKVFIMPSNWEENIGSMKEFNECIPIMMNQGVTRCVYCHDRYLEKNVQKDTSKLDDRILGFFKPKSKKQKLV